MEVWAIRIQTLEHDYKKDHIVPDNEENKL